MIKAVLFDYGGVLTPGGRSGCIQRYIGAVYGIAPEVLNADVDIMLLARVGDISEVEFFAEMNRRHPNGPRLTLRNFLENSDSFIKNLPVYDLAAALRKNGIQTGILSNIFSFTANALRERGFYEGFDPIILSCTEHIAKPDPKIYQLAASRLGMQPNEILFVDDMERNLGPAHKIGMHTLLANDPKQIADDIKIILSNKDGLAL